jgi:hypothetical protein
VSNLLSEKVITLGIDLNKLRKDLIPEMEGQDHLYEITNMVQFNKCNHSRNSNNTSNAGFCHI